MIKDNRCKTKYPIVLIHGIGYKDEDYWGNIPTVLKKHGAEIYLGGQSEFANIKDNAEQLKCNLEKILKKHEKINLIAHSKGGVEARYMISKLNMADYIASLTTMATPHHGIKAIDLIRKKSKKALGTLFEFFGLMLRLGGGEKPKSDEVYEQLTTDYMEVFNEMVPNAENVYYQSYAFDMKSFKTDIAMGLFHRIILKMEGNNDGLVSVGSAKWGEFRGVFPEKGDMGISHPMAVDGRNKRTDEITDFYVHVVERLRRIGY